MINADKKLTDNGHTQVAHTSLQLLPLIMNNIPQAVFWKDKDLIYLGCNRAFAEDAGLSSPEEIVGKTDFDMPWKDQAELYRADDRHVLDGGEPKLNYEEPQTTPSGSTTWLRTSKIPVYENDQIVAILGMYEDITAQKQVELDLLLRDRALASSLNAVIILNLSDNKPIYTNEALLKMTGYSFEDVKQITLSDITGDPEELPKIRAAVQTQGFFVGEELIKRKDGSSFPATFFTSLIRDNKGQPIAIQSSFFDISDRKRAEEALLENRSLYQSLVEVSPLSICRKDLAGRFTFANQRFLELSQITLADLVGKTDSDLHPSELAEKYRRDDLAVMESGQVQEIIEERAIHEGGTALVQTIKVPIYDGTGKVNGIQISFWDITDRKRAEEAIHASEERFRRFTEATIEGLVFHEQGTIIDANPAAITMFGLSESKDFIGGNLLGFLKPESHEMVLKQMQLETVAPYEVLCIHKNGSVFPVETSTRTYKHDDRIIRATSLRDITERKRAEAAIRDSEERLRAIYEGTNDAIMLLTEKGFFDCNSQTLKMFDYKTREEFTAIHPSDASPTLQPDGRDSLSASMEHIQTAYRQGYDRFEWIHRRANGEDFPAEVLLSAFDFSGQRVLQATVRDITERKQIEQALSASEAQFRSLFEQSADAILLIENGVFIDCNQATVELMRAANKTEFISLHPSKLSPEYQPDGRFSSEKADEMMRIALEKGSNRFEWTHRRVDGTDVPVEVLLTAISTGDRHLIHTVWRDITERKQAEQALQESQKFLQTVMDNIPQSIFWKDNNLNYLGCNSAFALDAGVASPGDIPGKNDWDMPWREQAELYRADDSLVMKSGVPKLNYEEPQTNPQGQITWLRTSKIPLYDGDGNVTAVLGMYEDITESKRAEQALRESQKFLQTVMDNIPQSIFWKDKNLIYLGCNSAFAADAGVNLPSDVVGKNDWDMPWKEQAELYRADDSLVMKNGVPKLNYEEPQTNPQGQITWLRTSKIPLYDSDGNVSAVLGMYEDITERKRLEAQVQEAYERRGLQVELSTQVSQSIASASSLEELYKRVVTQVKEQFGYYHTQLLRYEPVQEAVVLVTGYGETGAEMLATGHRLPMGEGLIGTAAASGETVLRPALENDPDWHPNPLLPETKGEIAVPIKLGDTILGVLDVQSNVADALDADDQLLLEGLCGQIAIAIDSTRLREDMSERLEEINRLYRAMSREGWQTYQQSTEVSSGFVFDQAGLRPARDIGLAEELFATVPLTMPGGEVIGNLAIADDPQRPLSSEDENFLQQVSEQVALALESARLFEQTQTALGEVQRRASELETVAELSATTSSVLDPDQLLQSVVDLAKERFGLYHAHIYTYDESWNTLLLTAGAGEIGRKLVAEEHAIPLTIEQSIVVRAARERKPVIVNDVNSEPGFLPNPLLPETYAEMAVPMTAGDKLLGVFDVQSNNPAGFSDRDANIYVTLAAQVAVALQNARLYAEQAALVTQLRELDRLKSSFLANMSHELRTPLNSILGFADVIIEELDGPLTENMSNDLRLIQKNGQHLLHLINDVLDMAKIEAGRMNLNPERFTAFEVIEEVTSITSTLASEKHLALFFEPDSDQNVKIFADRTRLRQVMINLVNNAIKFTENGKISLKLVALEGARVLYTIKDTGIGIPPDKLDAVFLEFTQVDSSTTRKAGGTGLGLPISRRLVEMHGGRLWAESTGVSGEGSTFFVELPVEARITETVEKQAK